MRTPIANLTKGFASDAGVAMDSSEKQRILTAYDRASLVALLAARGFYVIGERWRGQACGMVTDAVPAESSSGTPDPGDVGGRCTGGDNGGSRLTRALIVARALPPSRTPAAAVSPIFRSARRWAL